MKVIDSRKCNFVLYEFHIRNLKLVGLTQRPGECWEITYVLRLALSLGKSGFAAKPPQASKQTIPQAARPERA
jgi:hypothetical protein